MNGPRLPGRADLPDQPDDLRAILLRDRWKIIILVTVVGGGGYWYFDPTIPRPVRLFAIAFAAAAVLGYVPAIRIVDYLYRPSHTHLVDFDAETDRLRIWKLTPAQWRDLEVRNDEIYPLQAAEPCWEGKNYDPEENTIDGTWRGSATDLELIESREAINDVRHQLEDMAKQSLTIRVKQSTLVRNAVSDIVMSFLSSYESETIYDGEELQQQIDEAIEHWELEDHRTQVELDETGDDQTQAEPNIEQFEQVHAAVGDPRGE